MNVENRTQVDIKEHLKNKLAEIQPRAGPKIEFEFQALGVEMEGHFGKQHKKQIWPLFYNKRYSVPLIRDAWFAYQKGKVRDFRYFMGILNNLTKR